MPNLAPANARISTATMIAYGLSAWPMGAMAIAVFVFLPTVYAEITGISMAALGLVFMAVRLWDMVSDPLIGWLSDRTRSKFGRRRPWVFIAWAPMIAALLALCTPPPDATGVYLFVWSIVFFTAGTALYMPYTAWGAELSEAYHTRAKIFAWRHVFAALGTLSAAALLTVYDAEIDLPREAQALEAVVNWGSVLLVATLLVMLVKVPDRVAGHGDRPPIDWTRGLAQIRANRPLRVLIGAYFLNGIANALPATLFLLFVDHVLGVDAKIFGLLLYFGLAILGTPLWLILSARIGKHLAWRVAMLLAAVAFALALGIGPGDTILFYTAIVPLGLSLGADLTLPGAMQADVVDAERAETGARRTGIYFALWAMVAKMSLALAVGVSFVTLDLVGFEPGAVNDKMALIVLAVLFAGVPLVFKLAAALLVGRYPLTAQAHAELRARIEVQAARKIA